jgi:hypothetical protein
MPDITITLTSDQLKGVAEAVQDMQGGTADIVGITAFLKDYLETTWTNYEANKALRTLKRKTL